VVAGSIINVVDQFGDSATNAITITPSAGTIAGGSSIALTVNGGAMRFAADATNNNWINI
jgi:hypothetical protein